MAANII